MARLALLLLTSIACATAAWAYPSPTAAWANSTNPFDAPIASYGMPCVHAGTRIVIYPVQLKEAPVNGYARSAFIAFQLDSGAMMWNYTFRAAAGVNNSLQGQYCAAFSRTTSVVLAGGLTLQVVDSRFPIAFQTYNLSNVASDLPPAQPPIPVVGPTDGRVYVSYGGALHVFDETLTLKYKVGRSVYQHVDVVADGFFYYNDLLADGRNGAVCASTKDGSVIWQTSMNGDSLVASSGVVFVASNNLPVPIVTAYGALTGEKLWQTADFADYDALEGLFVGVYTVNPNAESGPNWTFTAREIVTGAVVWNTTVSMTSAPTVMGSGHIFTHGQVNNGYLTAVRSRDGAVAWQVAGAKGCTSYNGVAFERFYFTGTTGSCMSGNGAFAYQL